MRHGCVSRCVGGCVSVCVSGCVVGAVMIISEGVHQLVCR